MKAEPSTWRLIVDERDERKARARIGKFCKQMTIYADAAQVIESMAVRELLPNGKQWRDTIPKGDYRWRQRIEHLCMNRWRLVHRRVATADAITVACEHLSDTLGCDTNEAMGLIALEFYRRGAREF